VNPRAFQLFSEAVKARSGIVLGPDKAYFVESRLAPLARDEGFKSVAELVAVLAARPVDRRLRVAVDLLTTNETFFFRDVLPFERLRDDVLPPLARARAGAAIKMLCAACSTGQEPYSIAMLAEEARIPGLRLDILGADLSERCLEKAKAGLYTQFEVQRGLDDVRRARHFERVGEMWRVKASVRQAVRWQALNLLDIGPSLGRFDVVFCRNVLIYFDRETKARVLERLAEHTAEDGYLFLGAAETVIGLTEAFKPVAGKSGLYARNPAFKRRAA
jgi:chemotaxis protein methyltransferase CheR